ncbi:unnamed protein product [Didymodactylos carnosus]|uniref:G-protein coupled receptors family 1 profile domain-containing protein n=1 Tax=Didymodactylos carnosus TaxID=1234261 RepID=A0A815AQ18_9BILA|nr:unnamed protein product [Didymodactylos carnosus]CAF4042130.1 unnamed protein product [Didymodactylos carnosus]
MFILGLFGNISGIIVFSSRKFRHSTYGRLALASLFINLLCVFRYSLILHSDTRRWIANWAGYTWFNCKLYRFSSCLRILSAWITVFWTYDRFSYVTRVFQRFLNQSHFKRYKYYCMTFITLIIVLLVTGPTVYFYDSRYTSTVFRQGVITDNTTIITRLQWYISK